VDDFGRAKRLLAGALGATALGLAVAGSVDKTLGGGLVVVSWLVAIAALHRAGRAGSVSRDAPKQR
jgi:hypothetical protein